METTCSVDACDRPVARRGYCQTHYKRIQKTGDPGPPIRPREQPPEECTVEGCTRGASGPGCGRGYCASHYARWRKTGDAGPAEVRHWSPAPEKCTVWGCEAVPHALGLCSTHHARVLKHGDPGPAELIHQPLGPCKLPECEEVRHAEGCCRTHYRHWKRWGDPEVVHYGGWRGDDVGYQAVHSRLQKQLGRADANECRFCDAVARDWGYTHTDPDVKTDPKSGRPYSLDTRCYIPLCASCHKQFDRRMARRQPSGTEGPPRGS